MQGMSADEIAYEAHRYFNRKRAIDALLKGRLDPDTFDDILNENGINPHWLVDTIEDGNTVV